MAKRRRRYFSKLDLQGRLLLLLGAIIVVLWWYLEMTREEGGYPLYVVAVLWVSQLVFLLWLGNLLIYRWMGKRYPWRAAFNHRFFLQLLLTTLYSLFSINLTYYLFKLNYTEFPPSRNQFILLNIYGLLFLIPVLSLQFGLLFLRKWKQAILEQERLKKEQIQSELLSIKAQLSPHFLFNNLNILSSLIDPENDDAQDFLDQFAEVYRYVLKNREVELIPLREEVAFLDAYRFLLQRRFPRSLEIEADIPPDHLDYCLPPLSLQIVLENALKHNKLSEKSPLRVDLYTTDADAPALIIRNTLRLRKLPDREKTGFGLENIRRRYWLISQREIGIEQTETDFTVILPLVAKPQHEDTDH